MIGECGGPCASLNSGAQGHRIHSRPFGPNQSYVLFRQRRRKLGLAAPAQVPAQEAVNSQVVTSSRPFSPAPCILTWRLSWLLSIRVKAACSALLPLSAARKGAESTARVGRNGFPCLCRLRVACVVSVTERQLLVHQSPRLSSCALDRCRNSSACSSWISRCSGGTLGASARDTERFEPAVAQSIVRPPNTRQHARSPCCAPAPWVLPVAGVNRTRMLVRVLGSGPPRRTLRMVPEKSACARAA